jgi:hypothetical protein
MRLSFLNSLLSEKRTTYYGTETDIELLGPGYLGSDDHADIGCRVYSNMNTSPCVSYCKHHTKKRPRFASRLRLTLSPRSSCSSAESVQTMWAFGRRRPGVGLRRTARHSGRRWLGSIRCGCQIARVFVCWSGAGCKLSELILA